MEIGIHIIRQDMKKLFKPQIRTKNHSANDLRSRGAGIGEFPMRSIVRFGSRTTTAEAFPMWHDKRPIIEINTPEACHNSGDKILMKSKFSEYGVKTAEWSIVETEMMRLFEDAGANPNGIDDVVNRGWNKYPAIIKHKNSCKGKGIYFINSAEEFFNFIEETKNLDSYIIEEYKNFTKEYRLHVTKDGCFYTNRKMLKNDAEERWHRHDINSVWIMEENPLFEKPKNWDDVIAECVKALNAVGLTVGACDVKIQSEKGKRSDFVPDFIILEINSAPSMGEITLEKYRVELARLISEKIANYGKY